MLKPLALDDQTYEQLVSEALELLPTLAPAWTNHNAHDPGITLLELFCFLTELQRFYLQRITPEHERKYLKLLGALPRQAAPASVIALTEAAPAHLPWGAPAELGGIPYLVDRPVDTVSAALSLARTPCEPIADAYPFGVTPAVGDCCYLRLDGPLPPGQRAFYVQIAPVEGRTPLAQGFEPLARIDCAAWCGDGWQPAQADDGTFAFTQSGWLTVEVPRSFSRHESGWYLLRCTLTACCYDRAPTISWASAQAVELLQLEEVCGCASDTALSQSGRALARFVDCGDGYRPAADGESADLTIYAGSSLQSLEQSEADGRLRLNTAPDSILPDRFQLLVEERDGLFRFWSRVGDLAQSGARDGHYELDCAAGLLRFGDGVHGLAPRSVVVAAMTLTKGTRGQARAGLTFSIAGENASIAAHNPLAVTGGNDCESTAQAFSRFQQERGGVAQAVTAADYAALALATPGLCLESAGAFACGEGRVKVCVKPRHGPLSPVYLNNLRRQLYPKRMPCVQVEIVDPVYRTGVLHGIVCIVGIQAREAVLAAVSAFFDRAARVYGLRLDLADLAADLRALDCVAEVRSLSLHLSGGSVAKGGRPLSFPPDTLLQAPALALTWEELQ